jgi:L-fucose mutarotase/ribose pyranase (RbsD/FucU family)
VNNKWFLLTDRGDGAFFTDNSSGDTYWTFTPDNDGNFQIKSSKDKVNPVGLASQDGQPYFTEDDGKTSRSGDGDKTGGANLSNKDAVCTTWALYCYGAPEAVVEYNAATSLYSRMQEIYEESGGEFQVSLYMEQIGEQKGTVENAERLTALEKTMNADYQAWKLAKADGDHPVEIALTNPGFETGNMNGWSKIDGTTLYAAQGNDSFDNKQGSYYAEFWHKTGSYSAQQTVESMPAGLYKLSAYAYSSNDAAVLFMNDTESDTIGVSKKYSLGMYLAETSDITLGIKSSDTGSAWNCVDDFKLLYLGNDGTSWAALFDDTYKDEASYCYQQGLQEKLNILRAATTQEAIQRAYEAAREYESTEVAENVAAWKDYKQLLADATVLANDPNYASVSAQLSAMLQQAWTLDNAETDPTTKELKEDKTSGYDVIKAEYDRVRSMTPAGTDVTEAFVKNYDFTQNIVGINSGDATKGWRIDGNKGGGNWLINTGAKCGECWSGNDFDFYQIIEGAPAGVYQITVQGFTRAARDAKSWGFYFDQNTGQLLDKPVFGDWTPNEAHVYMNDNTGELSISYAHAHAVADAFFDSGAYTDPLGQYQYPNDMHSAGLCFANNEYKVSAFGLVAKDGDPMRIGMKGNNFGLDNWAIFTNFRLTYQAYQADIIEPELAKAVASLGEAHVGTELQKEMADLLARADAVSKSDGKAMFAILNDIFAFNVKKEASEKVFAELLSEEQNLEAVFADYKNKCSEEAKKSAQALQVEASEAYEDEETGLPTVTTEEAGQIIAKFPAVIRALKTPTDAGSDENPVDFTDLIENANMAASKGWTVEIGNMATDSSNKIAEFFNQENYNVYQQLTGLPEGLYAVQVQGFYRAGEIAEDWPTVEGKIESNAMMYVINDNKTLEEEGVPADTLNCPLRHVSAEAIGENPGFGGEATITPFKDKGDETPWYMPNTLSCASQFFAAEGEGGMNFYTNYVYVYVSGPLDTVTLGVKKEGPAIKNDWCAFSNWKLTGYGNQSVKEPGVQTCSYDPVTPVIGEIKGDVNGDGIVNGTDIQAVINYIVAGEYNEKADVNKDELVNGTDIQEIINIIVGQE